MEVELNGEETEVVLRALEVYRLEQLEQDVSIKYQRKLILAQSLGDPISLQEITKDWETEVKELKETIVLLEAKLIKVRDRLEEV